MTATTPPSDRTRVRRGAANANYERATLHAIIDAAYLCHVAFNDAKGTHCIPTACWREGEHLYIHGSNGGRLAKLLAEGTQACVTITHLDGLVLARSAFSHTMTGNSSSAGMPGAKPPVRPPASTSVRSPVARREMVASSGAAAGTVSAARTFMTTVPRRSGRL